MAECRQPTPEKPLIAIATPARSQAARKKLAYLLGPAKSSTTTPAVTDESVESKDRTVGGGVVAAEEELFFDCDAVSPTAPADETVAPPILEVATATKGTDNMKETYFSESAQSPALETPPRRDAPSTRGDEGAVVDSRKGNRPILGIRSTLCGGCRTEEVVRNRAFVEQGKLYCERCWAHWERCGRWSPTIRINTALPALDEHGRPQYGPEDCFIISDYVCKTNDFSLVDELISTLPEGKEFSDWHGARHHAVHLGGSDAQFDRDEEGSPVPRAWRETVGKLEKAFGIRAAAVRLNLYRSNADWKPLHHDRGQDDNGVPQVTVGVSFGVTRDFVMVHKQTGVTTAFPLRNGDVFVFTPELNWPWMHGISKAEAGAEDGIRLSFVIWGPRV